MKTFGLYIHWPFCLKKCPYCDFNSYALKYNEDEWINTLLNELDLFSNLFKNYKLETIFFGGGTPSLIAPEKIEIILAKIKSIWPYENLETTLEVNPSSIETHKLENFMKHGINRFSIGVQSLDDNDLKFLGRLHSSKEAINIVEHASKICKNISTDFIYTLPNETLALWKNKLNKILNLLDTNNIKHCSLYQLTIEENTGFYNDVRNKIWAPIDEDQQSLFYRYTHKIMNQHQWNHYEISNFANGIAFKSQHNLKYWQYENYLGIGPGAHSRMILNNAKMRFSNKKIPGQWKESILKARNFPFDSIEESKIIELKDQVEEKLFMGFRLKEGFTISAEELQYINQEHFQYLLDKKLMKKRNNKYCLSLNGQLKLNAILKLLFI